MKTFLINLDKNSDRLASSKEQLDKLGVEFERVRAVYGKDLSKSEKHRAVNRFRWWCANGYPVRDGEIGCALSHLNVYRKMIEQDIKVACVFEDDVHYHARFGDVVDTVGKFVDCDKPQVVLLTNFTKDRRMPEETEILPIPRDQCSAGYVITLPAARSILKANNPIQVPSDGWHRWCSHGLIELYHALPTVCGQDDRITHGSDVEQGEIVLCRNMKLPQLCAFKLKRLVGKIIDWSLPL